MTAEQFVKQRYPKARAEHYKRTFGKGYYLVWSDFPSGGGIRISEGETKAEAWKNAKNIITS